MNGKFSFRIIDHTLLAIIYVAPILGGVAWIWSDKTAQERLGERLLANADQIEISLVEAARTAKLVKEINPASEVDPNLVKNISDLNRFSEEGRVERTILYYDLIESLYLEQADLTHKLYAENNRLQTDIEILRNRLTRLSTDCAREADSLRGEVTRARDKAAFYEDYTERLSSIIEHASESKACASIIDLGGEFPMGGPEDYAEPGGDPE